MFLKISSDIHLEHLSVADAPALYEAVELSRANLAQYMAWEKSVADVSGARAYIKSRLTSGLDRAQWFSIQFHNQFSGVFGVKSLDRDKGVCELGYWLADNARGNRVVGQILAVMIPYLANEQGVRTIEFQCLENNFASIKIIERAGARLLRKVSNTLDIPNKEQAIGIYSLHV
ncbi:GNAT family N-acetyltransferase [Pseudoalteromonas sp. BDTF-M6]|uniref:GNAT family N-acetyltransferase n=1 Tax=Pseudoalteromonas sp. BDTF-M6 TaxID=2796132 RepID=UPI001BAE8305|nr:GNAT family N-acetyltransferase [Pseudoalteromonas sp. BDTF-M6]MBS3796604.1 GNAT family N-acetyltransferase [Pseudoalteromonas sp. BDTF-M6]